MTQSEDLYAVLQVHPTASAEVIKKAYHLLMQQNHPDRGGDLQAAQRINQAYDVLINTQKRARYDQRILQREQYRVQKMREQRQRTQKRARKEAAAKAEAARYAPPPELKKLSGNYKTPMLWGEHILVSDQRGNRVIILDRRKETVWTVGQKSPVRLSKPKLAHFSPDQTLWIADTGAQRIVQVNLKKELLWEYQDPLLSPGLRQQLNLSSLDVKTPGQVLITDSGLRLSLIHI